MDKKPSPAVVPIDGIDAVDLTRHALVEASAGTGKTYTIEHLVVRLLKETPDLNLENILLVTFTEKATSELKLRIRQKIEHTLDHDPALSAAVRQKLRATLDRFDDAAIHTIHGFCHTLLKEFPFETGNLFQQELIDDGPLLEKLLRSQMRTQWPKRYGRRLDTLLALAGFSANPDGFVESTVDLAQRFGLDPAHETLIPDPAQMDVDVLWQMVGETIRVLKTLVDGSPRLSAAYGQLNINARTKAAIVRDVVLPLEQALADVDADTCRLIDFMDLVATLGARHSSGETTLDRLVPNKWLKAGENLNVCPHLPAIKARLKDLVHGFAGLSHILMLASADCLRRDARELKARNGWLSYQDILTRVADFLTTPGNVAGITKLRRRYRVAFVDEFQDTDAVQWKIFKTLFLKGDNDPTGNRLFLIGDPKQAIYGFRGADVFTYLGARHQMNILAAEGKARRYDLAMNWRSTPELVGAFNRIFSQESWFGTQACQGAFEIGYPSAGSPDAGRLPVVLCHDPSQRPAFNIIDLTAATGHAAAKALLAGFICQEIRFLIEQGGIRIATGDNGQRALGYGDVAILVRSQSEFTLLEPLLNQAAIPYAYYRKPGLFQSPQAHWLSIVLRAVGNPEQTATVRLALLTPFFDLSPAILECWPDLPADHPSRQLLAHWQVQAGKRQWGRLFQSLMEDSGLMFRHCTDPEWERSETNFQQLFDYLAVAAYTRNLDIGGLAALLESLRLATINAGSDADIHQIADEGDKVQILTMHVSKGLEFPVVFIAGGLTVRQASGRHIYHTMDPTHPDQGCQKIIDLTKATGRQQAEKEREDEDKRLYYVALTRARAKLYVPYYPDSRNYAWRGPICRFVSQSIDQAFDRAADASLFGGWHQVGGPAITRSAAEAAPDKNSMGKTQLAAGPLLPTNTDFRHRKLALESFSSIAHRINPFPDLAGRSAAFSLPDDAGREDDEPMAGLISKSPVLDLSAGLPGGTRMGSMFHHIFETIDFQAVMDGPADMLADASLHRVVASALTLYRIESQWLPQVARMVADVLRTPIITVDGTALVLGQLSPAQRRHEMEFYFPLAIEPPEEVGVPGCSLTAASCGEMVIRGFVDLVFVWQGRYYIADWKSNRLEAGYHQDAMAQEMAAAGYERQYQLYTVATLRWLQHQLGERFDPYRHFGGAFYIFIRGVGAGRQAGIFHVPADQLLPLENLQKTIQDQIAGLQW